MVLLDAKSRYPPGRWDAMRTACQGKPREEAWPAWGNFKVLLEFSECMRIAIETALFPRIGAGVCRWYRSAALRTCLTLAIVGRRPRNTVQGSNLLKNFRYYFSEACRPRIIPDPEPPGSSTPHVRHMWCPTAIFTVLLRAQWREVPSSFPGRVSASAKNLQPLGIEERKM